MLELTFQNDIDGNYLIIINEFFSLSKIQLFFSKRIQILNRENYETLKFQYKK